MPIFFVILLFLLLGYGKIESASPSQLYGDGSRHGVVRVIDGDTVILEGGMRLRLTGIQAPELSFDPELPSHPLAEEAKQALERLVLRQTVTLHSLGAATDRYGRLLAHLEREDGLWIQGKLLEEGWVRVYTFPDNHSRAAAMLVKEHEARSNVRGLWQHPYYTIRTPEQTYDDIDTFQLVEARVYNATRVRSRIYLNFEDDWRTDFTIRIEAAARRLFSSAGIDPLDFKDKRIRVRGWITLRNGPEIQVTHLQQIELLP